MVRVKVADALRKRGMTQKELARLAGMRESTVSSICRGKQTCINFEHLSKIAAALQVQDIRDLIDFEEGD